MRIYRNLRFSRPFFLLPAAVGALVLGGCATAPLGPTIAVMPAPGMPFEQFQAIDASCRQFAQQQAAPYQGGASNSGVTSAALATGIGAAAGALIGGNSQVADNARVVIAHRDGAFEQIQVDRLLANSTVKPGDQILVLPKVDDKKRQFWKDMTQIIYQIAVSAKVVFGL